MNEVRLIDANALLDKQFRTSAFDFYKKVVAVDDIERAPTIEVTPTEIALTEYEALKNENAELRRLLQSAYDGYMSIYSCKRAPCIECIHNSKPICAEDWTWKWKHADEVLKLLESNDT